MFELLIQKFAIGLTVIATLLSGTAVVVPEPVETIPLTEIIQFELRVIELQQEVRNLEQELQQELQKDASFGAFYPVGGKRYKMWGSGCTASASSIILQSLTASVSGDEILMSRFGAIGYATLEPGSANKREFISFTGITQDGSTAKATLTGVSRGLSDFYPYAASSTLRMSHSGGSRVIFSNSPAFYGQFSVKQNDESITGTWTFDDGAMPKLDAYTAPTEDEELATKKYADDLTNAGAADSSTTTAGIVEIADSDELIDFSTTTGATDRQLVVRSYRFATSTDKLGATTTVMMTDSDGKVSQDFIDLTEGYTWTGDHTFVNATATDLDITDLTVSGDTQMVNATTTGDLEISGQLYIDAEGSQIATTTFTGIPTLPAIDPDSNNEAVRKKYVDDNTATAESGDSSRAANTGAGRQWISLSGGFQPDIIRITAYREDGGTSIHSSYGLWDDTNGQSSIRIKTGTGLSTASNATDIIYLCGQSSSACDTAINATLVATTSTDGFALDWDATLNDADIAYFFWEAYK